MFKQCVIPVLLYGAQTWRLTEKTIKKLETTQSAMLRSILNIKRKDKIKNEYIYKKTQIKNIKNIISKLKWNWAGHIIRFKDERWTKITTEWWPIERKRKKGRQLKRWKNSSRK